MHLMPKMYNILIKGFFFGEIDHKVGGSYIDLAKDSYFLLCGKE